MAPPPPCPPPSPCAWPPSPPTRPCQHTLPPHRGGSERARGLAHTRACTNMRASRTPLEHAAGAPGAACQARRSSPSSGLWKHPSKVRTRARTRTHPRRSRSARRWGSRCPSTPPAAGAAAGRRTPRWWR